jgi:chromosome segregation ATPase
MEQIMKIMPSLAALVTATSIGIATGHAWSDETTPGRYMQRWQQPSHWPAPPAGYGQMRPYYPPQRQYRAVPAAPVKNPVSAESKQSQEQLTEKSTELDRAQVTLEQLQLKLQHSREAERALNEKVAAITGEQQAFQAQVAKLQEKLETSNAALEQQSQQITNDQQQNLTLTAEHERLRSDLDSRDKQLATVQADLLASRQALQQAQSGNTLSSEQLGTAMAQADTLKNLLTELKTRLESQQTTLQHAEMQTAPQAVQQAVQQAQPETTRSEQQPDAVGSEVAMLRSVLSELKIQLENTNIRLQDSEQQLAACRQDQTRAKE